MDCFQFFPLNSVSMENKIQKFDYLSIETNKPGYMVSKIRFIFVNVVLQLHVKVR